MLMIASGFFWEGFKCKSPGVAAACCFCPTGSVRQGNDAVGDSLH
jgi:hypothetical protein